MSYDLDPLNATNARTALDLVSAVNTASGGIFSILILVSVFFFFSIGFKGAGFEGVENFMASSFATTIIASLLFFVGLLSWYIVLIPFGIFLVLMIIKSTN